MSDHKPVACDFHDDFTAAATRERDVEGGSSNGKTQRQRGKVKDVYTAAGEEFVRLNTVSESVEQRLDDFSS